ncbi:MAG TPA: phage tail sheath C-terminal domain-containing protein, partial [Myxococcota bacterium]|nr:phage tail sheath C-terminal domain-containing protein [Myxococcota bacterium]
NGLAPLMVGAAGEVQVVRSVTTYTLDTYGSADDTLLDIQTIRVLDYVRYAVRVKLQQKLGRAKIADLAVTPNTTDPDKIRAMILGVLLQCQNDLGYLERVEEHADRLVVERDGSSPGRVNASIPADIVDGLHVMAATIDLILG